MKDCITIELVKEMLAKEQSTLAAIDNQIKRTEASLQMLVANKNATVGKIQILSAQIETASEVEMGTTENG